MVPPPWRAVSPTGVLYYLHDHAGLKDLAKREGIKTFDLEFQVGYEKVEGVQTVGNCEDPQHAGGWVGFFRLVWLQPGAAACQVRADRVRLWHP